MKKIIILVVFALFATCGTSFGAALATDTITSAGGQQIFGGVDATDAQTGVLLGKMSKGVNFRARYLTTGYAIATKHTSGTKVYGTGHDSTAIYFVEVGVAGVIPALSDAGNASFGATWTAM